MKKQYKIELDGKHIGHTYLESHDAPMGVVFGKIYLKNIESAYEFFNSYCTKNSIAVNDDVPGEEFITTQSIKGLRVFNPEGVEVKGVGVSISGIQSDCEIEIIGIPYPFYNEEFSHHV